MALAQAILFRPLGVQSFDNLYGGRVVVVPTNKASRNFRYPRGVMAQRANLLRGISGWSLNPCNRFPDGLQQ